MNAKIIAAAVALTAVAACQQKRPTETTGMGNIPVERVEMVTDRDYYDSAMSQAADTNFVILHEDESTLFSFVDKIVAHGGNYYILDKSDARTVVGFDGAGRPFARYGAIGQGPGEYTFPMDLFVDDDYVYVMANSKKLIRYAHDGRMVDERQLPFTAAATAGLSDGRYIHNLLADGNGGPSLTITDSLMEAAGQLLRYPEGYVGGSATGNVFRSVPDGISFFLSQADSLYVVGHDGSPAKVIAFDFGSRSIPAEAKLDWLEFRKNNRGASYLKFVDSPMRVNDSLWVAWVEGDDGDYTFVFDPTKNRSGALRHEAGRNSAVDALLPMATTSDGRLISLLTEEMSDFWGDAAQLPDSVARTLASGGRVLLLNRF